LKPAKGGTRVADDVHAQLRVPGFVAVAAAERAAEVTQDEIDRFASAYEAICGSSARRSYRAETFARVIEFSDDGRAAADPEAASWVARAGTAHGTDGAPAPAPESLEGQFALVSYDKAAGAVSVATDPFGMFPFFRASRGAMHYFSTSALALAKHLGAQPDVLGLFVYLRTGYHFGTRTNWIGVERLDPAQRIVFTGGEARVERYWQPEPDESVASLGLKAAARLCTEICVETFGKLYAEEPSTWADLTGGYDSRLLTLSLRRAGVRFRVNTVGADWMEDVRLAKKVAEASNLLWTRYVPPTEPSEELVHLFPLALAAGHGHLDAVELARVLATHEAKLAAAPMLLTGGGGEHFQYYAWQTEFAHAGRSTRVNIDNFVRMRMLGAPFDTSVFAGYPGRELEGDVRDRSVAWIAPYRDEINTRQLDLLYAYKMMGHFGAFTGAAASVLRNELPFYMRPVFSAAFSTSDRHRNAHRLVGHMIELLEPRASAIRTTHGGPAEPLRLRNAHRFVPYYLLLGSKAIHKVTGVQLYRPRATRRLPASPEWRRAAVRTLAGPDPDSFRSRSLFKPGELERLLEQAAVPDGGAPLFGRLLTVEGALRAVDTEVVR
jgi:hypothetical protein